jgi:hypothetical protein
LVDGEGCALTFWDTLKIIKDLWEINGIIEGSLEVKLPTIWTVEKQR